jgi:PTS system fructose-specific IIA component
MELEEFLDPQVIKVGMKKNDKKSVLIDLSNVLKNAGYIDDAEIFLEDIYKRESIGITGIGNYIAIPHGKSAAVKKVGVAIGILENEIEWETMDDNGVKVVILFSVGNDPNGAETHLRLLSKVAQRLGNDEVVSSLIESKSVQDVIKSFKTA